MGDEREMLVLAVLGGIGSGKSSVARQLAEWGAVLVDADQLAAEALAGGDVQRTLRTEFGEGVFRPDGGVDRSALGRRVFEDPAALAVLEGLVHPRVQDRTRRILATAAQNRTPAAVLDVPLLLERSPFASAVDLFIYVDCPADERTRRAAARHGWDAAELARREALQLPLREKRERADVVFDNRGTPEALRDQLQRWFDTAGGWAGLREQIRRRPPQH